MLLLLCGPSDVAKAAVASLIVKKNKTWKYSTLEDMAGVAEQTGFTFGDPGLTAMILCECLRALELDGDHAVLTAEEGDELIPLVQEEMGKECVAVCFGKSTGDYDVKITAGKSAADAYKMLEPMLGKKGKKK